MPGPGLRLAGPRKNAPVWLETENLWAGTGEESSASARVGRQDLAFVMMVGRRFATEPLPSLGICRRRLPATVLAQPWRTREKVFIVCMLLSPLPLHRQLVAIRRKSGPPLPVSSWRSKGAPSSCASKLGPNKSSPRRPLTSSNTDIWL